MTMQTMGGMSYTPASELYMIMDVHHTLLLNNYIYTLKHTLWLMYIHTPM